MNPEIRVGQLYQAKASVHRFRVLRIDGIRVYFAVNGRDNGNYCLIEHLKNSVINGEAILLKERGRPKVILEPEVFEPVVMNRLDAVE